MNKYFLKMYEHFSKRKSKKNDVRIEMKIQFTITRTKQRLTDALGKCMQNRLATNWFMALKCFCGGA